jgi:hypothetical protein
MNMADQSNQLVLKLWNYCNILRDDLSACAHAQAGGLSYLLARGAQGSGFDTAQHGL